MKYLLWGGLLYGAWYLWRHRQPPAPVQPITQPIGPITLTVEYPFTDNPASVGPRPYVYYDTTGQHLTLTKPRTGFTGFGA